MSTTHQIRILIVPEAAVQSVMSLTALLPAGVLLPSAAAAAAVCVCVCHDVSV
jgi:hypothetical protein